MDNGHKLSNRSFPSSNRFKAIDYIPSAKQLEPLILLKIHLSGESLVSLARTLVVSPGTARHVHKHLLSQ